MEQNISTKIIAITIIFSVFSLVFAPTAKVMAIDADDYWGGSAIRQYVNDNSGLADGDTARDPRQIVVDIIKIVLGFLGILAVIIILFAGFKWMTAGGNEENITSAKQMLIAGIIGLVIILSSYALATFIINQIVASTTGTTIN